MRRSELPDLDKLAGRLQASRSAFLLVHFAGVRAEGVGG